MQKRVIVSLNANLFEVLKSISQKTGRTTSFLIKDSLQYTIANNIYHIDTFKNEKLNKNFDFYLEEKDYELICMIAASSNISVSCLIRQSIISYIKIFYTAHYTTLSKRMSLKEFFELGDFKFFSNFEVSDKNLDSSDWETLVRISIEAGHIDRAKEFLKILEPSPLSNFPWYNIAQSRIARLEKDLAASEIFAQKAMRHSYDNSSAGQAYYRLAVIAIAKGDSLLFSTYLDLSLSLLDYNRDWMLIMQILSGKAQEAILAKKINEYNLYMNNVKKILSIHPNYYFLAYARRIEAQAEFLIGNNKTAIEKTKEGLQYAEQCGSILSLFDQYEIRGLLEIGITDSPNDSIEFLEKANILENKFRPDSRTSLASTLIEVVKTIKTNSYYSTAQNNIIEIELLAKKQNVNSANYSFLSNYLMYLYGEQEERSAAIIQLEKIQMETNNSEISNIVVNLINTGLIDLNLLVKACIV